MVSRQQFERLSESCDNFLVCHYLHSKVLYRPSNILHCIDQVKSGVPTGELRFFNEVVVFSSKDLLVNFPHLVHVYLFLHSFRVREYNHILLTAWYAAYTIRAGVKGVLTS